MEQKQIIANQTLRDLIKDSVKEALAEMGNAVNDKSDDLLSLKQLAQYFDVSLVTIHAWRKSGLLPRSIKQGGKVFFKKSEVLTLVESKKSRKQ